MDVLHRHYQQAFNKYKMNQQLVGPVLTSWHVFDKYYQLSDESPAYAAALILHPSRGKALTQKNWPKAWHKKIFTGVKKLWEDEYKNLPTVYTTPSIVPVLELDEYDLLAQELNVIGTEPDVDEYETYTSQPPIPIDCSPLVWWLRDEQKERCPRLSKMAIDISQYLPCPYGVWRMLPFFAYAPFNRPEWDKFAVAVRSDAVGATEPLSLLVQRALPELSSVLESTRETILQNSQRLAIRLEARLEGIQDSLDALLQGKVPVTFTGHFEAGPAVSLAPAPAPEPPVPGMPVVAALAKVFTVRDVWKEWEEGIAGQPAVRVLEETWGSRWCPGNGIGVQFCRRKVIWDELLARTASGKSEEEAVAELELLRAGRSLNRLVHKLKQRRRRGQGQGRIRVQAIEGAGLG
ncbi:high-osmolarity-induced transcription protein 1 [Fusarium bulbicola]|nr:high-osmolarity-induced transcription protein 1 [Fusarium bulbicola]